MGVFLYIDEKLINFDDPTALVKDEFRRYFARKELAPLLLAEVCVLDMLYAVANMNDGYYKERLVLKGGLSVRNLVPLIDHRFSFDADFNPNTFANHTYGELSDIRRDLLRYAQTKDCTTGASVTTNNAMLHFVEIEYYDALKEQGYRIVERPKIEICKACRVFMKPVVTPINTMIDLEILGLKPPAVGHLQLEEQFANKLFVIGARGRQRNHFDAYDAFRIYSNNKIDWKLTKKIFQTLTERRKTKTSAYINECRHQLDAIARNASKRRSLQDTVFRIETLDFDAMIEQVKSLYDFKG